MVRAQPQISVTSNVERQRLDSFISCDKVKCIAVVQLTELNANYLLLSFRIAKTYHLCAKMSLSPCYVSIQTIVLLRISCHWSFGCLKVHCSQWRYLFGSILQGLSRALSLSISHTLPPPPPPPPPPNNA